MSNLIKILYDVAALRTEYQHLHQTLFRLSARRILELVNRPDTHQSDSVSLELDTLAGRLAHLRTECDGLGEQDLGIRRGREISHALSNYIQALSDTLTALQNVCKHQRNNNADEPQQRTKKQAFLAIYDDAVQYQQRLGAKLNELIANL